MESRFIAGGDYNAKHTIWGSRLTNTKGRALLNSINDLKLSFASPGTPTNWPTAPKKIPDHIDFCFTKGIPNQLLETFSKTLYASPLKCHLSNRKTNCIRFKTKVSNALATTFSLKTE